MEQGNFLKTILSWADKQEDQKTAKEWIKNLLEKKNIDFGRSKDAGKGLSLSNMEMIISRLNSNGLVLDLQSNKTQGKASKGVPPQVLSRARKAFSSGNWDSFDFTENKITPKYVQARENERVRDQAYQRSRQREYGKIDIQAPRLRELPTRTGVSSIAPSFTGTAGISRPLLPKVQAPRQVTSTQIGRSFPSSQPSDNNQMSNRQGLLEDAFKRLNRAGGVIPTPDYNTLPIASDDIFNQSLLFFDPILMKKRWDYD
jgi:hypothetical protein